MNTINFQGVTGWFIRSPRSSAIGMGVWIYQDGDVLIDAGFSRACGKVLDACMSGAPKRLMLTHVHEDHVGCAGELVKKGVRVMVPAPLKADILKMSRIRLPFYRRVIWGQPRLPDPEALQVGESWTENDGLRYIATPGHSASHHVIWDEQKGFVFLGDLYLGPRMTMGHPWEDPKRIAESLRLVRDLHPEAAFCAHRGLLRHPITALTRKIEYIEWLVERTLEFAAKGMSIPEITMRVLGGEKLISKLTGGLYSRQNVIESILNGPRPEFPD